jgi:hypothetical protein
MGGNQDWRPSVENRNSPGHPTLGIQLAPERQLSGFLDCCRHLGRIGGMKTTQLPRFGA